MDRKFFAILRWFNMSFDVFASNKLKSLTQLQDPELVLKILIEIDKKFFENVALSIDENKKLHNFQEVIKAIRQFYITKDMDFDDDAIDVYKAINAFECDQEFLIPLAEVIIAMTASIDENDRYINIMSSMNHDDSAVIFQILNEKIKNKPNEVDPVEEVNSSSRERDLEEHNNLLLRIETLERENHELTENNQQLVYQIEDLKSQLDQVNHNFFDLQSKYNELGSELELRNLKSDKDYEDQVSLSIQMSELKGKLDAKELTVIKIREEKERITADFTQKIQNLKIENEALREKAMKHDIMKEKLDKYEAKFEEFNLLKSQKLQFEKTIKDLDERNKKLQSFVDTDKSKLLKKIEDLNFVVEEKKFKEDVMKKEIEIYKENIIQKENELNEIMKKVENYKSHEIINEMEKIDSNFEKKSTLVEIEEQSIIKKQKLELEAKYRILHEENLNLIKTKHESEETIKSLLAENEELKQEKLKHAKKSEKYAKFKEEERRYINKVEDLMSQLRDFDKLKIEYENSKLQNLKEMNELENKFNNLNFQNSQKYNEEVSKLREKLSSIEHELNFLKKENRRLEENLDSNKNLENQKKTHQNENALVLERLKEISMDENKELKKNLADKNDLIHKLQETNKMYESQFKEFQEKIMKLDQKHKDFSVEELKKKDELITYYKSTLEQTEKSLEEEEHFMTRVFYDLAVNYLNTKNELSLLQAKETI